MVIKLGLLIICTCICGAIGQLEIINKWSFLNFDFPSDFNVQSFRPENTLFTGLEVTNDRIFLAIPNVRDGIPVALATIPRNTVPGSSPLLKAYPNWLFQSAISNYSCSGLVSVYRIKTDSCNRLWALDAGIVNSIDAYRQACPPKLLAFDLNTDKVVRTIVLSEDVIRPNSGLTNFIIDESVQGKCDSSFFYVLDTLAPGIIVFDGIKEQAWRVQHPSMFPNPDHATYNIVGDTFTFMDGIIGVAHSPQLATLFFQPLATDRIFSLPTSALTKGPLQELEELPVSVAGRKSSQGLALALNHNDNTLFFSPFSETSVASWNVLTNEQNLLVSDPVNLQFTSDIRWKEDGSLWLISSRFHRFFKRTVTPNEINLRVMRIQLQTPKPSISSIFGNRFYF